MAIASNSRIVFVLTLFAATTVCLAQQDGIMHMPPPQRHGMQMMPPSPDPSSTQAGSIAPAPNQSTPQGTAPVTKATSPDAATAGTAGGGTTAGTNPKLPPAQKALITLTEKGLKIDATNSSLAQIMREVSNLTGMKVEGLGKDQRIYGLYGPDKPSVILGKLLQGTGYNVMMIGTQANGAPKTLTLSSRDPNAKKSEQSASTAMNDDDDIAGVDNTPPDDGSHPPQPQNPTPPNH
jgi:hypothetical protein